MSKYAKREFQIGDYWLSKQSRSPAWCRTWFDTATGQTKRASLGTPDLSEAKDLLKEWFIDQHRPQEVATEDMTLAQVLTQYWNNHGQHLPSQSSIKTASRYWLEYWQDKSVADFVGIRAQEQFHKWLADEKNLSDATINRTILVGKAALNRAWQNGEINSVPKIMSRTVTEAPPKGRPLEVEEVQRLLKHTNNERMYRFVLLMIATASRPDAIRELQKSQCDLEAGLIYLNAPGRKQTKKYRPTVRMPTQLRDLIEKADDGYLVTYRGKPVTTLRKSWVKLREEAGLDDQVQPYSLRHTMARRLRASGVPAWEVAAQLGHQQTGMSITEKYAASSPDYLLKSTEAIETFLSELPLNV